MVLVCPFQLKDILFFYNFLTLAYLVAPKPVSKWCSQEGSCAREHASSHYCCSSLTVSWHSLG